LIVILAYLLTYYLSDGRPYNVTKLLSKT